MTICKYLGFCFAENILNINCFYKIDECLYEKYVKLILEYKREDEIKENIMLNNIIQEEYKIIHEGDCRLSQILNGQHHKSL